jgi:hypothetical protein
MTAIAREQLAAQVVAVMRAVFARMDGNEMRHVLKCAEQQITAAEYNEETSETATFRSL